MQNRIALLCQVLNCNSIDQRVLIIHDTPRNKLSWFIHHYIKIYKFFLVYFQVQCEVRKGWAFFYNDDAMHKRYKRPCDENETQVPQTADKV